MFARFALFKLGHNAVFVRFVGVLFARFLGINGAPAIGDDNLAGGFKLKLVDFSHHGCGGENAIGIEGSDEAFSHQVVHHLFVASEVCGLRRHVGGYNGVVVGHF